ncbi:MAG: hypothetical protein KDB63_20830, partial [Nocardioidaceae bacterium]|nr:hypothetical protein [Nocardioidaceae bacterium]
MRTSTIAQGSHRAPRPRRATSLLVVVTLAFLWILTACGGTTGDESTGSQSGDSSAPLVYGVFATPLEEPWDGAIHAALTSAA